MVKKLNTGLHVMIIIFLCVAIFFSLVSFGFSILNAIKVPYRAINGPAGACLWNFLAGKVIFQCFSLVTFIENDKSSFCCLTKYIFDLNICEYNEVGSEFTPFKMELPGGILAYCV